METVLMEASMGGGTEKNGDVLIGGTTIERRPPVKDEYPDDRGFSLTPSNSPVDIKFEKVTFTASEGSLFKGTSK